jgi:hypothetical protein
MRPFTTIFTLLSGLLLLQAFTSLVLAQPITYQAGGHFLVGSPKGEFGRVVGHKGLGGSLFGGVHFGAVPVLLGLEGSFMIYGHETREEPFSLTIPDVRVDVTTTNAYLTSHLLLRLQPGTGFIRPYLDGLVGINHLTTNTSISGDDYYDEYDGGGFSSNHVNDTGFSFGTGGGVMIKLADTLTEEGHPLDVLLDLRIRYLIGGRAEYLREGDIYRDLGVVEFDTYRSKTDAVFFQIGVALSF